MTCARNADVFEHLLVELLEHVQSAVVGLEGVGILVEAERLQPLSNLAHVVSSSRSALASLGSGVSKPSVNHS
jgi:hypothetical protein